MDRRRRTSSDETGSKVFSKGPMWGGSWKGELVRSGSLLRIFSLSFSIFVLKKVEKVLQSC